MTEGIIQKVFEKHKKKPRAKWYGRIDVASDMNELQQELIAEIKNSSLQFEHPSLLRLLIGDNQ